MAIKQWIKGAWKSLTIKVNALILTVSLFSANLETALPVVKEYISPGAYKFLGFIAAINILLRFKTNASLMNRGAPKQ